MVVGQSWSTTGTFTSEVTNNPTTETLFINTRTLLGLENITVNNVGYQNCLKIEMHHSYTNKNTMTGGKAHRINWRCPDVGLVKSVAVNNFVDSTGMPQYRWQVRELISTAP
jgi:hypothetical protein